MPYLLAFTENAVLFFVLFFFLLIYYFLINFKLYIQCLASTPMRPSGRRGVGLFHLASMPVIKAEFIVFPEEPEVNVSASDFHFPLGCISMLSSHSNTTDTVKIYQMKSMYGLK